MNAKQARAYLKVANNGATTELNRFYNAAREKMDNGYNQNDGKVTMSYSSLLLSDEGVKSLKIEGYSIKKVPQLGGIDQLEISW